MRTVARETCAPSTLSDIMIAYNISAKRLEPLTRGRQVISAICILTTRRSRFTPWWGDNDMRGIENDYPESPGRLEPYGDILFSNVPMRTLN